MFHPITSFVSFVECVFANTCAFGSVTIPSSALKSPPTIGMFLLQFVVCFSIVVCIFRRVGRISRVVEVHNHQFDTLVVYHDRGGGGPFDDVFVPPLLVQDNDNSVFVIVFSCSRKHVLVICFPNF